MSELTKEQLAEGRRLLAEYQAAVMECTAERLGAGYARKRDAWIGYLQEHGVALISAAEAKASAAEFARAILLHVEARIDAWLEGATELHGEAANRCKVRAEILERDVLSELRELAEQRGIELTATAAGEAEKGEA